MAHKNILIVSSDEQGNHVETILDSADELVAQYEQIGIDDCSTDLALRGFPVVKGLVGPIPENKTTVRYETVAVFEELTKIWAATKTKRRRRTKAAIEAERAALAAAGQLEDSSEPPVPAPLGIFKMPVMGSNESIS